MSKSNGQCPLCGHPTGCSSFYANNSREFYRCECCFLIYVPPAYHLSRAEEKAEYDKHQNSPEDAGYRKFLSRLYIPLRERIMTGAQGLDFGSGPGPTLSRMFEETGCRMKIYDPFYAPDRKSLSLSNQYDFITASEVLEHCHDPSADLDLLWSLLKPGGWLGIMTGMALDRNSFATWRYKDDLTHVCFFSKQTMEWIAVKYQTKMLLSGRDVCLFQKKKENTTQ